MSGKNYNILWMSFTVNQKNNPCSSMLISFHLGIKNQYQKVKVRFTGEKYDILSNTNTKRPSNI